MNTINTSTPPTDTIPLLQKIAYGIGMMGNQMLPAALMIFSVVLIQDLGMNPLLWGLISFVPRLFDALTDPIMGFISDNTKSRWGRRRPYIFIGSIMAGLSYILMWQISAENSEMYNFTYFLACSIWFYLGLTIFATPYVAMGYEMSSDFHERTRLMALSQWIGQWAWVIVPWFWVVLYDTRYFATATEGARYLSIWVGLGCLAMTMVPALFCKTQKVDEASLQDLSRKNFKNNITVFLKGFKDTFMCKPFRKLCIATLGVYSAFNTTAAFSFFIIVYYINQGSTELAGTWPTWFGTMSAIATCFLVIPIITFMSQKLGKKNAFIISQCISIFGYLMFWWAFNPSNPWLMFIPLPLWAFGIGSLFTLMMSMTADVCDLDELNTGARREGAFGAVYWWMVKFGFAVSGLGTGLILSFIGFDQSVAVQSAEAQTGLRLAYIFVPIAGTLLAIFVMRNYEVDETRAHEIRTALEAKRKEKKLATAARKDQNSASKKTPTEYNNSADLTGNNQAVEPTI
ncbi:MAG: GPH family glycoside/pentoside/hexuronide:cation symporter [Lentisphaeria bacterium]|jgi:GPH family glycoside/pentoside/hexuronide:cation symporter